MTNPKNKNKMPETNEQHDIESETSEAVVESKKEDFKPNDADRAFIQVLGQANGRIATKDEEGLDVYTPQRDAEGNFGGREVKLVNAAKRCLEPTVKNTHVISVKLPKGRMDTQHPRVDFMTYKKAEASYGGWWSCPAFEFNTKEEMEEASTALAESISGGEHIITNFDRLEQACNFYGESKDPKDAQLKMNARSTKKLLDVMRNAIQNETKHHPSRLKDAPKRFNLSATMLLLESSESETSDLALWVNPRRSDRSGGRNNNRVQNTRSSGFADDVID